ncbi:YlbF family regulator [Enterococcus dongliensis]|uniref:YlbF family regulator n=1 Tax=Enterococcus dongliensis TaxID=2559925 RepID=A0AAP5NKL2_9ENTE|nr:YlbF family regulator [Enterococcus dongliensis]MDT2596491.1 YlbF family regulator [Enterococcus dongliensis]MDT2604113.1 YlbF family regulator [Enterococcus dongliensis]MDT2613059.1 YlbF family regulator [Enterococcus dongliensis]MDT2634533.1 YlbF family regulator [Enterococcus dongliensis]MDT2636483.1 YlbF family regulator [Enterococcus dongliensis]
MNLKNEAAVDAALTHLTALLSENEVIQDYQKLKKRVAENETLKELEEGIKTAQKEAVQFAHYDKPEAERAALKKADQLTKEFNQHPLVIAYREQLYEANELLQHLTNSIQKEVNAALEADELTREGEQ